MASTLPQISTECCPAPCTEPTTVQVPGPAGTSGSNGTNGTNGVNAFTTFTAIYTIPAELASSVATVADTSWMVIGQKLYGSRIDGSIHAFFEVSAIGGATSVTLKNLEDTPSNAYLENSAPGNTLTVGSKLCPAGIQGPGISATGSAGGDLKGTYPNPRIGIANTKGASLWGNGTDTVAVTAGTNGHMLAYDSTDAEGVKSFKALPLTGDTDLADNRILRSDGATGLPVPAQPSKIEVSDTGAIAAVGSAVGVLGNARGTDAVDLQVTRSAATMVASGARSFIGSGENNTASSTESVVVGGDSNTAATGQRAAIVGGQSNSATGQESFIGGGQLNTATNTQAAVCGGDSNDATGEESFVGGGTGNTSSGLRSAIAGGSGNTASGIEAAICGGVNNSASQTLSSVGGGGSNTASAQYSTIPGGFGASADKHGQLSHASGFFASAGDAQTFELIWRIATTNATPAQMFLDGTSLLASIPTNTTWAFHIHTVARDSNGATAESAAWEVKGVISNDNGTTSLVTAVTSVTLADDTAGTWQHAVTADNTNDALVITVTGEAARNIRWVSHARIVQVTYP